MKSKLAYAVVWLVVVIFGAPDSPGLLQRIREFFKGDLGA